jgi:hypothetical protein
MGTPAFSTPVVAPNEPVIIEPNEAIAVAIFAGIGFRVDPDGKIVGLIMLALEKTGWRLVRAD